VGARVGIPGEAVGVALGGVGSALEKPAYDHALAVGELGNDGVDVRDERRPRVGGPAGNSRREPYDGAAAIARMRVTADVPSAL
jgi:hypothetical protein